MSASFHIRLSGPGIVPEAVDFDDLAEILSPLREMLFSRAAENDPGLDTEELKFALLQIQDGSLTAAIRPSKPAPVVQALFDVTKAMKDGSVSLLGPLTIDRMEQVKKVSEKIGCSVEFLDEQKRTLAILRPDTDLLGSAAKWIEGTTSLYGVLEKVGGATPRVGIRPSQGRLISCEASRDIAKKLSGRLYEWVGVSGVAKWDPADQIIKSFKIEHVLPFQGGSIGDAFRELSNLVGDCFAGKDPVKLVRGWRGQD